MKRKKLKIKILSLIQKTIKKWLDDETCWEFK
jgi:hypothetical protein